MRVYGELIRAALELLSADPSTAANKFTGRIFFNTATNVPKVVDSAGTVKPLKTDETTAQTIVQAAAAAIITGMTIDSAVYTSMVFGVEIKRGTTLFFNQRIALQYVNSAWVIAESNLIGEGDATDGASGLTWAKTGTTTAQLTVAAEANANNTTIKWKVLEAYHA